MGAPWFKFYPTDYLADSKVRMLTREQRSILVELWCYCAKDGSVQANAKAIARLLAEQEEIIVEALEVLAPFFTVEGDRMFSHRMQAESEAYERKCEKLRANASTGGKHRQANAKAIAQAKPQAESAEPEPEPEVLKRIPPTKVGLSESEGIWHSRLRESWAKNQPDGKAAPYSPPGATEKLFLKIVRSRVASGEELAWAGHLYCQRMLGSGQYVVALKTFLGPQGFYQAELAEARAMIASQQVGA